MNTTKFKSQVTKGNNIGAGFVRIPLHIRANFSIGDQYKAIINSKIKYYCKIRNYNGNGIFIPTEINAKNKLYKKVVEVEFGCNNEDCCHELDISCLSCPDLLMREPT